MKYRKIRKQLTHEAANEMFQVVQQQIGNEQENILYWTQRKGKKLEWIDTFILGTDKFESPEDAIKVSNDKLEYLSEKLKDLKRFFDPNKKVRTIF